MRKPYQIAFAICIVALVGVILWPLVRVYQGESSLTYKGRPLKTWFYGANGTFFSIPTRSAAQQAINALGTNAFPFLLFTLKEKGGDGGVYAKVYRALPDLVKRRLPYPVSGDDVAFYALTHLEPMLKRPDRSQLEAVAECVPRLQNPRLRMRALLLLIAYHKNEPAVLRLCRKLLNDSDEGICLEAAICLAKGATASDPVESRLFPILLSGLESKTYRKRLLDIAHYAPRQQPPGVWPLRPGGETPTEDQLLQWQVIMASGTLRRYLTPEQKARLNQAWP